MQFFDMNHTTRQIDYGKVRFFVRQAEDLRLF